MLETPSIFKYFFSEVTILKCGQSAGKISVRIKLMNNDWLNSIDPGIGNYIAGFTDGEGSFNISMIKRRDYVGKWKVLASLNISQKDRVILEFIKNIFGCGTLRERSDGVVYFEVTKIGFLSEKIIPFFNRFNFLSANKKKNFLIFSEIVNLMTNKEHLTDKGFEKIVRLREVLNEGKGRKRKYNLAELITEKSSETIRKTISNHSGMIPTI